MLTNEMLLDTCAAHALTALIQKFPMLDAEGEYGKKLSDEEAGKLKRQLAESAYEYASYMLIAREKSLEWLKENKLDSAPNN